MSIDRPLSRPYSGAMLFMRVIARRIGMIAWLTLAASLMVTGDLVIDLAFEEAEIEASTDTASLPEAPDNAAEHVLMPSQKGDSLASVGPVGPWAALAVALASTWVPTQATRRASPLYERPPRSSPVPLPLPLRI